MQQDTQTATDEDVFLLLDAVIDDLTHVRDRSRRRARLPCPNPAATVAGQLRTLNRQSDLFTQAVNGCLNGVADGIEKAAAAGQL